MIEPLPPTAIARDIARQNGGVEPLVARLLAEHGPAWPFDDAAGAIVTEWCERSDYTTSEPTWFALRSMMRSEWRAAVYHATTA